jgi:hypothetical protein
MGIFGFGTPDPPDADRSTSDLQHEASQLAWRVQNKGPEETAHIHGRLDEIDEALQDRGGW